MKSIRGVLAPLILLAATSCYHPDPGSPGFYCHVDDNPACPEGQQCVDGRCLDKRGYVADAATTPDDMTPSPDLAPAQCAPKGGDCTYHNDKACCSNYCIYKTNTCK